MTALAAAAAAVALTVIGASTRRGTRAGVALRAVQVGEELGLSPLRLRELATGGLVHDIGKLSVPNSILKKPGRLLDSEFDVIKRHPEIGFRMLIDLGFSAGVGQLVLDHHERLAAPAIGGPCLARPRRLGP